MRPGSLDTKIVVKSLPSPTASQDVYGVPGGADTNVMTLWARKEPISGNENVEGSRRRSPRRWKYTTHYRPGIDATMKVVDGSTTLQIDSVLRPLNRSGELAIEATEMSS